MWRKVLREYFAFPKKERQGIFVLLLIWLFVVFYRIYSTHNYEYSNWQIKYITDSVITARNNHFEKRTETKRPTENLLEKHTKSLNEVSFNELKQLGISSRTSALIMKFKQSGVDLKNAYYVDKIYGITEEEKKIIKEYFLFNSKSNENEFVQKRSNEIFELNTCDSMSLESLPKIGPALSSRIIKYRDRLGGFVDKKQLLEVYGLDTTVFKLIENRLTLDNRQLKKIKINKVSYEELIKFPYLNYKLAKVIINYREQHGNFKSQEDLLKIHLMNSKIIDKIEAYIDYTDEH